jgi:hypothetical protein
VAGIASNLQSQQPAVIIVVIVISESSSYRCAFHVLRHFSGSLPGRSLLLPSRQLQQRGRFLVVTVCTCCYLLMMGHAAAAAMMSCWSMNRIVSHQHPFLWLFASTFKPPFIVPFFALLFVLKGTLLALSSASPLLALSLALSNGTWWCGGINASENAPLLPGGRV